MIQFRFIKKRIIACFVILSLMPVFGNVTAQNNVEEVTRTVILSLEREGTTRSYEDYFGGMGTDLQVAGITVLRAMREKANINQQRLLAELKRMKASGEIIEYSSLWLVDAVIVTGSDKAIETLLNRSDVSEVFEDIFLSVRSGEPTPIDTSLFHELLPAVDQMRRGIVGDESTRGYGRKITVIGGTLPDFLPYPPRRMLVRTPRAAAVIEPAILNWDWLAVTAAGWEDGWDTLGVATESEIEYFQAFDEENRASLSSLLRLMQRVVSPDEGRLHLDVLLLTWDPKFSDEYRMIWDAIRAIEATQIPVVLTFPEGSSAIVKSLPGIFVQGTWKSSRAPSSVHRVPQLLLTPDGDIYASDLVAAGYTAGTLAILRGTDSKALIPTLYQSIKYSMGDDETPKLDIASSIAALKYGIATIEGNVTRKASREPEQGVRVDAATAFETKSTFTDEEGRYSINVVADDALIRIRGRAFYDDSVSVSLREKKTINVDFSITPMKRIEVTGQIVNKSEEGVPGSIIFKIGNEDFAETVSGDNGEYSISLLPGNFSVEIIPSFPHGMSLIKRVEVGTTNRRRNFSVDRADIGIISLDGNRSLLQYYSSVLDSLELSYSFHLLDGEFINQSMLDKLQYRTVIVYTGEVTPLASATNLMNMLDEFASRGGHVLLTGQRIAEHLSSVGVVKKSGIGFGGNRDELLLYATGKTGLPKYVTLSDPGGANNQNDPDALTVPANSEIPFYYDSEHGMPAAAIVPYGRNGSLALVGFGIESVYSPHKSKSFAERRAVIDYLLRRLWNIGVGQVSVRRLETQNTDIGRRIRLMRNVPDPFMEKTEIRFFIPEPARVVVEVYNIRGEIVSTLLDDSRDLGGYAILWNPEALGVDLPSGIYICRMTVTGQTGVTMTLLSKMVHL